MMSVNQLILKTVKLIYLYDKNQIKHCLNKKTEKTL